MPRSSVTAAAAEEVESDLPLSGPAQTNSSADTAVVDLTADSPVNSKSTREEWRAKHRKQAGQTNASTSGATATRPKTRSQSSTEASLNASIEIIDIPDSPEEVAGAPKFKTPSKKRPHQETSSKTVPPPAQPPTPEAVYKCPVCLDSNRELKAKGIGLMSIICGHILCKDCAKEVKTECPTCRKKFRKGQIHPLFI